jgi:hypothetical protein
MRKIIEYTVIHGSQSFEKKINDLISAGWQPHGNFLLDCHDDYVQIMVKYEMVKYEDEEKKAKQMDFVWNIILQPPAPSYSARLIEDEADKIE